MCYCLLFIAKALVRTLAAFTMIASANAVHERVRERMSFAGVSCLFLFLFAWIRIGAACRELSAARARGSMSFWGMIDHGIVVGGLAMQMLFVWQTSKSTERGGSVEEASTIFWLWVLYLLCALLVTPTGGGAESVPVGEKVKASKYATMLCASEQLGEPVKPIAFENRLGGARLLNVSATRDGKELESMLKTLSKARSLTVPLLVTNSAGFLVTAYARLQYKFVTGELDLHDYNALCVRFGPSPAHLIQRAMQAQDTTQVGLVLCFVLPDVLMERNISVDNALLFAIELMCARAVILACAQGKLPRTAVRAFYALEAGAAVKRPALLGGRKHALKLLEASNSVALARSLDTGDAQRKLRFGAVCELCDFPNACDSVSDALDAFRATYNVGYLGRGDL